MYNEDLGIERAEENFEKEYKQIREREPVLIALAFIIGLIFGMLLMKGSINEEMLYFYGFLP